MVRIRSSAIRFLISTPARAACSVEIAITSGMARPRACGQAITSTVTVRVDGVGHAAQQGPGDEGEDARAGGEVEQEGRGPVGQGLGTGGRCLGLGHQPLDAGQGGVVADGCDPDADAGVRGDGAGHHGVTGPAQDGLGFARDHGFVELGVALRNRAVGGHPGAGADQDEVAGPAARTRGLSRCRTP